MELHVIINGRSEASVLRALHTLREQRPQAEVSGIAADLGIAAGCEQVATRLAQVDILVNNLGIFEPKPFEQIADAAKFTAAVWHDARSLQADAEKKYGYIGF